MDGFYLRSLCPGEVCYQDVIGIETIICNAMDENPVFNTYLDDLPGGSLNRGLSRVTFVIPALNEANNLYGLRETLGKQIVPPGIELEVVISDNGSHQETLDQERALEIGGKHVEVVTGSIKGSVGSARKFGVNRAIQRYHQENPGASSSEHILVCFDADTRILNNDYITTIKEIFSNPNIMVAFGQVGYFTSAGSLIKGNLNTSIQMFYDRLFIRLIFRLNRRSIKDFIYSSFDVIRTYSLVLRESAYRRFTSGFRDEDATGEDIRISLELRRKLQPSQIPFNKRLSVLNSAREVEGKSGRISLIKLIKYIVNTNIFAEHIPFILRKNFQSLTSEEQAQLQNLRTRDVVASFIKEVEKEVYGQDLEDGEEIGNVVRERQRRRLIDLGKKVIQAKNLITGGDIPGKFAVIKAVR